MAKIKRIVTSEVEGRNLSDFYGDNSLAMDTNGVVNYYGSNEMNPLIGPGVVYGANHDSGDGYGYNTIKLIPHAPGGDVYDDRYIVVDPTAPNHIHLRAGGTQDASNAELILGGEKNFVKIDDQDREVIISARANQTSMAHLNLNTEASDTMLTGDVVSAVPGWNVEVNGVMYYIQDVQVGEGTTIYAPGAPFQPNGVYNVFSPDYTSEWRFDSDGTLYGPAEGALQVAGIYSTNSLQVVSDGDMTISSNTGNMNFYMDGGMYIGPADSNNQIMKRSDLIAVDAKTLPTGGTTGQVLSKVDDTDFNATWVDAAAGSSSTSVIKHAVKLGESVTKGQAVYVSSADGTNMIVSKASNATEATSSKTLGLIETTGVLNDLVNVVAEGLLEGLDTSTATAGDPVWLGVDGNLIYGLANKPVAPDHLVFIGVVTRVNQNNGEIFVKVQNGFELNELHNVLLEADGSTADNEILAFDSATGLWKNQTAAEAGLATAASPTFSGNLTADTIVASSASTVASIFGTNTTGNVSIAGGLTNATMNIANGAISSGSRSVNINNNASGTASITTNINNIGSSASTINLNGTVYAKGTTFIRALENDYGNTSNITLFANLASGHLNIANNAAFTGQLNIATGAGTSNKIINIGTGSTLGTTTITLGSSAGAANNIVLNGPVTVSGAINATTFGPSTNSTAGYLFDSTTIGLTYWGRYITTGNVEIANGTSFSGQLNLASGGTNSGTKTINIGSNGIAGSTTNVTIGTGTGAISNTYLNGRVIMPTPTVPGSATATGTAGQIAWDANYVYVCTATNTWKRTALSTW